jgi:two-component system cell cycle sensor histidine kinase/response regulator CckA
MGWKIEGRTRLENDLMAGKPTYKELEQRIKALAKEASELKRTEEALRKSEERYRNLFDTVSDFIYTHDLNGCFLTVNRGGAQTLGYKPEDMVGRSISHFMLPEYRQAFYDEYLVQINKQGAFNGVTEYIAKDGTTHYIEYRSVMVRQKGREPYVSGTGRDVTDRITGRNEVRKLEQQLQQAQKMKAIGTLAGGIAHDFNNLLMGILGNTSLMLLDMESNDPRYERLQVIKKHVRLGADLTKQLVAFARGGRYEVKPTDINELIKSTAKMFGRTKKEIGIHTRYQEGLWIVEVDQGQIEHVLLNLYINAWQAMAGLGDLYLETENIMLDEKYAKPYTVKPGRYVKISITDSGIGMDKETQLRIFEPFFTTKEMGRGMGLGLASVYGIIKNHGGYINVYSEKNEGTTFRVYLPASEKGVPKEKGTVEKTLKGAGLILLVDDEDMIVDVGEQMLKTLGYDVLLARSGKEAVEVYKNNQDKVDLVILDMIMPEMGGGEVYNRLKEIDPEIKTLLSSGYSLNEKASNILARGCNGFIQKPFDLTALSGKIREILGKDK